MSCIRKIPAKLPRRMSGSGKVRSGVEEQKVLNQMMGLSEPRASEGAGCGVGGHIDKTEEKMVEKALRETGIE